MLTTLSVIFLILSIPFLVQAGRNRNIFSSSPSLIRLRRTISAPTVPSKKNIAGTRPKTKRRATDGGEAVSSIGALADEVVAEPEEDEGMTSDTSAESYVRFGRGMTYVEEKVGGGLVRSSVDHDRDPGIAFGGPSHTYAPTR
ncbi:hypothetical protein BGX38DRAFT_914221 [Terfezia claveryi]|nr:hypothetical protein BGX38DRAFT_914221 [Terfezia claveryi]